LILFQINSKYRGFDFFTKDLDRTCKKLSSIFILLNFDANPVQYSIEQSSNLKVFINNKALLL
ncbi:hypothetical protein, partial [Campylobacter jejuni]|uniref:hypothetical protein n=1 Tax=Campylobacter jejuni TaxID=197 RepID=UPI0012874CC6